jgi:hypothetical protein
MSDPFGIEKALFEAPPHQARRPVDERGVPYDPANAGKRKAEKRPKVGPNLATKKKHAWRSPVGRGAYGNHPARPHWSQQAGNARFWANAAVNNPGPVGAGAAAGGAVALQSQRSKMSDKNKKRTDVATGAAVGGAATQVGGQKRMYRQLRDAQKVENNLDWGELNSNNKLRAKKEHRKTFDRLGSESRRASEGGKNARAYAQHYNRNFPEGFKSSKVRRAVASGKATRNINRASVVGAVAGGAAVAGGYKAKEKLKKSDETSAFGVDHG